MGKGSVESNSGKIEYKVVSSKPGDVRRIINLINAESILSGAVLKVNSSEVNDWIDSGISVVAKLPDGEIIGHLSAHQWPQSKWVELRSSVVKPHYRGKGISSAINAVMIDKVKSKYAKATLVAFTNKAGTGKGILIGAGFRDAQYHNLPKELFSVGPIYRGKKEYGYRIFVMNL